MIFELTEKQVAKYKTWIKALDAKVAKEQLNSGKYDSPFILSLLEKGIPYTGAIGGGTTFSFTPTTIGVGVSATHFSGESINLTDYEDW